MRLPIPFLQTATLALALLLPAYGCAQEQESADETPAAAPTALQVREIPAELRPGVEALAKGNAEFATDLYAKLAFKEGNLFFSPFSISTALAMTYAGARGETAREMAEVLHLSTSADSLPPVYRALQTSLERGVELGGYRLNIANRLWGQEGFAWRPEYREVTRTGYGAEMQALDFRKDPEQARVTINEWVSEKTEKRISELLQPGVLDDETRLVLTNAVYFKGTWARQFDAQRTVDGPFRVSEARTVQVPMMDQRGPFPHGRTDQLQILELPYEGGDLSMLILLPHELNDLREIESSLNAANLSAWTQGLATSEITVKMPRFLINSEFSLGETLAAMGMPSAFRAEAADFSGMDGARDLFLSAVVHKAFVEVNEEGTEAAAATGGTMSLTSFSGFIADHPFLFLIRDNITGSILFLGRVIDPTS